MRRALLASALTLLAGAAAAQPSAPHCQSSRSQDPDTGAIVQKTRLAPSPDGGTAPLFVWTSDDPDSVMFVAIRGGAEMRYAGCFDTTLRVDGQPVTLTRVRHDKDPDSKRGTVLEYVRAEIPWSEAPKLAAARSITFQVCDDRLQADEEVVCETRHLLEVAARWRREQAGKR
jgi:hypothetical protein